MFALLLLSMTATYEAAPAGAFPNGTETALHFYSCDPNAPISVSAIEVHGKNGKLMYPINFGDIRSVRLISFNKGREYKKDLVNVQVFSYSKNLHGNYEWQNVIPAFLQWLLNRIDGCAIAKNCPLKPGPLDLNIKLDLHYFSALFKLIDKNVAHQFVIKMFENVKGKEGEQIACNVVQFKAA